MTTEATTGVPLYTVANHLKVNWRTVVKWIHTGELKGTRTETETWRVAVDDLNAFCRKFDFAEYKLPTG